jgi:UDP-N-acetyl-D-galactosamine dehydrogenase
MGLTFKENCPDLRNTRVVDVISELRSFGCAVDVHDPWVDPEEARAEYGLELVETPQPGSYDGLVVAVAHRQFRETGAETFGALCRPNHVLYDLKHLFANSASDLRL